VHSAPEAGAPTDPRAAGGLARHTTGGLASRRSGVLYSCHSEVG
jgi:hypothetical protein